jgi:hypothetical protein
MLVAPYLHLLSIQPELLFRSAARYLLPSYPTRGGSRPYKTWQKIASVATDTSAATTEASSACL